MKRIVLILSILLVLSLACSVGSTPPKLSDIDQVATIVAATMSVPNGIRATEPPPPPIDETATVVISPPPTETVGEPTGVKVAYVRDENIWLWEEGVGARQLTNTGGVSNVQISDDGRLIAFTEQIDLWVVSTDGGDPAQLVDQAYLASVPHNSDVVGTPHFASYEFIPGTHTLFFDLFMDTDSYPFSYGGLHRVNADAPLPTQVLLEGQSGDRYYSPDKQWVALSQPNHIAIMRVDGSDYRVFFDFDPILTYSEYFFKPEVIWKSSSDGFYLALPPPDFLGNPSEPGRFWYIGLDGRVAQLAVFLSGPVWDAIPRVSPDGTKVLYVKEVGEGREIHIVDASTADTVFIASADDSVGILGWADSDHFGFWYGNIDKPWYATVSEHSQQDLTDIYPTLEYSVYWLEDGRLIFKSQQELRISAPGGPSMVIDAPLISLDFDVAE
ncbi:MAG: hypothetical protein HN736_18385 [Anaerolineae bacterium]|jgi:hypothetical protein|nr:hypothetical protein [Anaerolineae bacterium]MBT4311814.1 hypothetical protein [Anaerolineae bacterium]MBT4456680.1 hypothetical protein [Anaerolineae bacterium]MBT4843306.1 hypothetical protein [Anaerolineae bacterium]MBT6062106.1 hypothetical protein [Anaerolineae bacterium]